MMRISPKWAYLLLVMAWACGPAHEGNFVVEQGSDGGGRILTACSFDKLETQCWVDSGNFQSRVAKASDFKSYPSLGEQQRISLSGEASTVDDIIEIKKISFAGKSAAHVHVSMGSLPLSLNLEGIDGVLGQDVLFSDVLHLNFASHMLTMGGPQGDIPARRPLEVGIQGQIFITATINGISIRGIWDTGAAGTVLDKSFVETNSTLFRHLKKTKATDGNGQKISLDKYEVKNVSVGNLKIPSLIVGTMDFSKMNESTGESVEALFGFNIISQANWVIDRQNKVWGNEALK